MNQSGRASTNAHSHCTIAIFVVDSVAVEPVAGVDDEVVEAVDLIGPRLVQLVEVEVEEAYVGRPDVVSHAGADEERGPEI